MSIMTVDGFHAKIDYDPDIDMFRGEILGLSGGADFYGKNPRELRNEFKTSLKVYLEVCDEKKIEPFKKFSGKFNLRVSEELHSKIAVQAAAEEKSINQWVVDVLSNSIELNANR